MCGECSCFGRLQYGCVALCCVHVLGDCGMVVLHHVMITGFLATKLEISSNKSGKILNYAWLDCVDVKSVNLKYIQF